MERANNKRKGFTLIELLVVISITGLLSSIILASVSSAREKAQNSYTVQSIKQVLNAIAIVGTQSSDYPASTDLLSPTSIVSLSSNSPSQCFAMIQLLGNSNVVKQEFAPYLPSFPNIKPVRMNISGTDYDVCPSYRCITYDSNTGICSKVSITYPIKGSSGSCLPGFTKYVFSPGVYECYADPFSINP